MQCPLAAKSTGTTPPHRRYKQLVNGDWRYVNRIKKQYFYWFKPMPLQCRVYSLRTSDRDTKNEWKIMSKVFVLFFFQKLSFRKSPFCDCLFRDSKKGKIGSVIFFHLLLVRLAASASSSSYSWVRFGSNQVSILHLEGIPPGVIYNWRHSCGSLRQVSQWKVAERFNIQVLDVWSNIFQSL